MEKEDFKYEDKEKYIEKAYVYEDNDCSFIINEDLWDDDYIMDFANTLRSTYFNDKDKILNQMLDLKLRDFYAYKNYSDEFIKENIGKPEFIIDFHVDKNEERKKYYCVLRFSNHQLDEHTIELGFLDIFTYCDVTISRIK